MNRRDSFLTRPSYFSSTFFVVHTLSARNMNAVRRRQGPIFWSLWLVLLLSGFGRDGPGHGRILEVRADDATEEPTADPGSVEPTAPTSPTGVKDLRQCYRTVRNTCNCGLVKKGSRCVQATVAAECNPSKNQRQQFKSRIRKRYKRWCRKQKKKGRNFRGQKNRKRRKKRKRRKRDRRNANMNNRRLMPSAFE